MKDTNIHDPISLLHVHLTIMRSFLRRPHLPLTKGDYVIRIVGPVLNASLDPEDEYFHLSKQAHRYGKKEGMRRQMSKVVVAVGKPPPRPSSNPRPRPSSNPRPRPSSNPPPKAVVQSPAQGRWQTPAQGRRPIPCPRPLANPRPRPSDKAVVQSQHKAVVQSQHKAVIQSQHKSGIKPGLDAAIKPESGIVEGSDDWNDVLQGIEPEECDLLDKAGARTPPRQMLGYWISLLAQIPESAIVSISVFEKAEKTKTLGIS
ncbi:hypothetical protein BC938DRAFT_473590 [Jimgerdemannia flammicorona]|uniref:Uncharacterized protein n=1 Tax=Jimgerdemannia flammicorona TaxID=994334 RepID=A0A433Q3N6_9FUNG|nr:hypothetical protein BC938DRAFT_473590 [Jimgerdemannia flammicorona]